MRCVIAGNWKMNGTVAGVADYAAALALAAGHVDLVIFPPAPLLERFVRVLDGSPVALGAQDCHAAMSGAHTGDISALLLRECGASHVILGHSERRQNHGETNADIRAKVAAAIQAGLIPVVCVGETEAERDAGAAADVVRSQLAHSLPEDFAGMVAYEPVWAIGTGRTPTLSDITAMHAGIRAVLSARFPGSFPAMPILYGGSVKPDNAAALLALPEVGGALVGGASLNPGDFLAIAAAAPRD